MEPARAGAAAAAVAPADLPSVNGALGAAAGLARLVGGPLGGLTLGLGGLPGVVATDAVSFAAAAVLLGAECVRRSRAPGDGPAGARTPAVPGQLLRQWADGLRTTLRSPVLSRLLVVVGCMGMAQGAFVVLFVLFVLRDLGGDGTDVGLLRGVQAVGALAGAAVLGLLTARLAPARLLTASLAGFALLSLVIWNAPVVTTGLGLYVVLFVAVGLPGLTATTALTTLLQTASPPGSRGRVVSLVLALSGAAQALGMLAAGLLGDGPGLTAGLQVQGGLYVLAAVLSRRLSRCTPEAADRGPHAVRRSVSR
jgi:hypothetical protein